MKPYTLGFIFDKTLSQVLLVHKLTPSWQKGRMNGVGGMVEPGEDSLTGMIREVVEETDLTTDPEKWVMVGTLSGPEWTMDVFAYIYEKHTTDARQGGKEAVDWFPVDHVPSTALSNLSWLIPLSLDKLTHDYFSPIAVSYYK